MRGWWGITGLVLATACASAGGASTAGFSRNVGIATAPELAEMVNRVLSLHQFEVEQEAGPPNIFVQTHWQTRRPFTDEEILGINEAQIRATVRARPRSLTSTLGEVYTVEMTIEQRVRTMDSSYWLYQTHTGLAQEHAARIVEDLEQLLEVGVRKH